MSNLSEYEKKRLENIRANEALLRGLDLPAQVKKKNLKKHVPKPARAPKKPAVATRVSSRIRGEQPDPKLYEPPTTKRVKLEKKMTEDEEKKFLEVFVDKLKIPSVKKQRRPKQIDLYESLQKLEIRHEWSTVKVTPNRITSCLFHPSPVKLLGCAADNNGWIGFWDVNGQEEETGDPVICRHRPHTENVTDMHFNPVDSSKLLSSSYDGFIQIFDMNTAKFDTLKLGSNDHFVTGFDMTKDGHSAWFGTSGGDLGFVDTRARKKDAVVRRIKDKKIGCVHLNPVHQHLLALACNDRTSTILDLRMWDDSKDIDPLQSIEHGYSVTSNYWSPNGDILATTAYDNLIRLFDLNDKKSLELKTAIKHNCATGRWVTNFRARWNTNKIQGLNHQHLVIGNMNHRLDIISGETGKEIVALHDEDHITAIPSVAQFHPNTATPAILTGNGSGRMLCWT